jgi:hypothetical protein
MLLPAHQLRNPSPRLSKTRPLVGRPDLLPLVPILRQPEGNPPIRQTLWSALSAARLLSATRRTALRWHPILSSQSPPETSPRSWPASVSSATAPSASRRRHERRRTAMTRASSPRTLPIRVHGSNRPDHQGQCVPASTRPPGSGNGPAHRRAPPPPKRRHKTDKGGTHNGHTQIRSPDRGTSLPSGDVGTSRSPEVR